MKSPFPGMDPYLESPLQWRGFHAFVMTSLAATLNPDLPPGFIAKVEERCYLVPPQRDIYPDVAIKGQPSPEQPRGGTAVLERAAAAEPTGVLRFLVEERRERFIEILDLSGTGMVITVIELLSPANKAPGDHGRDAYLRKRNDLLVTDTSLMEIDLLRGGAHTIAVSAERLQPFGAWDYVACLHRGARPAEYAFWLNRVRNPLPLVQVPLTEAYPDVILNLQAVFDRAYEDGAFHRALDYRAEPEPPLAPEDAAWADALLREKELRP